MNFRHLSLAIAAVIAFAFFNSASAQAPRGEKRLPASLEQKVERLEAELKAKGYDVARGDWSLFRIEDCKYAIASMGNCVGNNPAAPYVVASVPLWPDEFVDPDMKDVFGPMPGGGWVTHRLDPREALVVLGQLPPPGGYFGIQSYIYSRAGKINTEDPIYQKVDEPELRDILFTASPDPARVLVMPSLGNSNNNVTIEQQSDAAFDQQRYFIITPDAAMERAVTDALLGAGVENRNQIFTEQISPELVHVGLGPEADDLMTIIRYAEPKDEAAGNRWREQLPLVVLRVRDRNTSRATEPYPVPAYDEKTARSELELKDQLGKLVDGIKQQWAQPAARTGAFESLRIKVDLLGQHCLPRPMNCLADTQDTDYQISPSVTLDAGEVVAVTGTLGTATGNATYVSLSVNRFAVLMGVANISDRQLKGSASRFATVGDADKFYVHYFARDCAGLTNCTAITEDQVPRGETIKLVQRNYIVPGTARGADPQLVLNPQLIVLDGASRPAGG